MSEDSTDSKPPKLKLKSAGERKPQGEGTASNEHSAPEPETPVRESIMKLRRPIEEADLTTSEPALESEAAGQTFDPQNPFGSNAAPEPKPPRVSAPDPTPAAASAEPDRAAVAPVNSPAPAPAPAQSVATPRPEPLPEPKPHSGILSSLFIILALVLVLGGGGYAIWLVLSESPTNDTQSEVSSEGVATSPKLNPIEKAKAAISKVPFLKTEEVVNEGAEPETAPAPKQSDSQTTSPEPAVETPTGSTSVEALDSNLKQAVSAFLSSAHIGGVRSGANARVMLNGESYQTGEEVDSHTGLTFVGTQGGKVLFRDKNGIVYAKSF